MTVNKYERYIRKSILNGKTVRRKSAYKAHPFFVFTGLGEDELQKEYDCHTRYVFQDQYRSYRAPNWWKWETQIGPDRRKSKQLCRKLTVENLDDLVFPDGRKYQWGYW